MRLSVIALTGWLVLCVAGPAQAQKSPPPGPADLLPAGTMGYAELYKPGITANEIRELFKGTPIYDIPDGFAELEAKAASKYGSSWALMGPKIAALLLSPEVVGEIDKAQGVAAAFLGMKFDKHGPAPEYVIIIQPGNSNVPGFLTRSLLSFAPMKVKETVGDVKIYRQINIYKTQSTTKPGDPNPPPPKTEIHENDPSVAMIRGFIVIGSHQAVKDCILRSVGNAKGESLARDKDFLGVRDKVGGKPGLFAYVKMSAMASLMMDLGKSGPPDMAQFMAAYNKAVNFKAFKAVGLSLSLQKGALHFRELVTLDPKEKSPLLEFYPTKAVNTELLHFAPKDAVLAIAISNADGDQRWQKLVKLMDEALPAKAIGGMKLSGLIGEVEKQLGAEFGPDIMGKTTNIGFALGNPLTAPVVITKIEGPNFNEHRHEPQVPMVLILEAKDAQAAGDLVKLIHKACNLATKKDLEPVKKTINGQAVTTLEMRATYSLSYGIVGNTVVAGPYAEGVAQALADGKAKKGLAADAKALAQIKEFKDPIAVTLMKPGTLIGSYALLGVTSHGTSMKASTPDKAFPNKPPEPDQRDKPKKPAVDPPKKPAQPKLVDGTENLNLLPTNIGEKEAGQPKPSAQPKTTVTIQKDSPEEAKMKKEVMAILDHEPWLVIGTMRGADFFMQEGKSAGWDKFVPKIVNYAMDKWLEGAKYGKITIDAADPAPKPPETKKLEIKDPKKEPPEIKKLKPGEYNLKIKDGAFQLETEDFKLDKGVTFKVTVGDKKPAIQPGKKDVESVLNVTGELTKQDANKDGFCQKVHKVELTAGKKYTINLLADKKKFFDTYLIVQDAKGKDLAKNDDGGEGLNSRLVFQPKVTATYQIMVTSFKEGETGRYTLTITE